MLGNVYFSHGNTRTEGGSGRYIVRAKAMLPFNEFHEPAKNIFNLKVSMDLYNINDMITALRIKLNGKLDQ